MDVVSDMVTEWLALRIVIKELELAEHPPIIDKYGREWVWRGGDLYAHCGMARIAKWITEDINLPPAALKDNTNYALCNVCRGE